MATMSARKCLDCDHEFDILTHNGETVVVSNSEVYAGGCPECGVDADVKAVISPTLGIDLGGEAGYGKHYPYYDRALCCRVSSAAHRRRICKERGLTPLESDASDLERQAVDARRESNEAIRKMNEYHEKLDTASEFADYRRGRDRGLWR